MDKNLARAVIRERLSKKDDRSYVDEQICKNLLNSELVVGNNLFIYNSLPSEVCTKKIIEHYIELGKNVYLPIVNGDEMNLVQVNKDTKYLKGAFSILEPIGDVLKADNVKIDTTIVPLLGYDNQKNRLGKGKGYYDKYFANNDSLKIALAYSCQEVESIDCDIHDVKMDYIINEFGVI